jgi:calcineurin-like phosphoesterase family protein
MDDLGNSLFNIGLGNIDFDINKNSRVPSNDMLLVEPEEKNNSEKEYTKDGRDKNKTSIVFKPDENKYPNPDNTSNGVDTTPEIGSREDFNDNNPSIFDAKSMMNQTYDLLTNMRSEFRALLLHFTNNIPSGIDKDLITVTETIYKNLIRSNNKIDTHSKLIFRNFDNKLFNSIYINYLKTLKEINFKNPNLELSLAQDRSLFKETENYRSILKALKIQEKESVDIREIFGSWDEIKILVNSIYNIYSNLEKIDISKYTYNNAVYLKKQVGTDPEHIKYIYSITKRIYLSANLLTDTIRDININLCNFFKQICPKNSFEIYKDPTKIMYKIDKLNPWVSSDYHLLKELIKARDENYEFTKKIILMHNEVVKPNDLFLFLGDLSESEIFDQNMMKAQKDLIGLCNLLHGRKIIITGNNDVCSDEFLKKCGFLEVYRDPVLLEKICFSHGPIPCKPGIVNIHGHIHGNKTYWVNTYGDYIDAFYGLWGGPVKLNFLLNKKTLDSYRDGCITRLDKVNIDPETVKVPGNII